jgi:hypothetical protein
MIENLPELLTAGDDAGVYRFSCDAKWLPRDLPKKRVDALREVLLSHFIDYPLLGHSLELSKRRVDAVEASADVDNHGAWHVQVNLAKLVFLPGNDPREELTQLQALFGGMKDFFTAHPEHRCYVQLCNERDRHSRVYGTLACRIPQDKKPSLVDAAYTQRLQGLTAANPTLAAWLRAVALALGKLGPWSWVCLTEDHLFGRCKGPWAQSRAATRTATIASQPQG